MPSQRITRVNELLRREIASTLFRVITAEDFEVSGITVLEVDTAPNLRRAKVYVSYRGSEEESNTVLHKLKKHRGEIQNIVSKSVILKYTPQLEFVLDPSIARGDHILGILSNLDIPEDDEETMEPSDESTE